MTTPASEPREPPSTIGRCQHGGAANETRAEVNLLFTPGRTVHIRAETACRLRDTLRVFQN